MTAVRNHQRHRPEEARDGFGRAALAEDTAEGRMPTARRGGAGRYARVKVGETDDDPEGYDPQSHRPAEVRAGFSIKGACAWSGLSRSGIYRAASEGKVIFRKVGRTVIVDGPSLAAYLQGLPVATIRGAPGKSR